MRIVVYGDPKPQGSKRAFVVRGSDGRARAVVAESAGAALRQWRADVVEAARRELAVMGPLDGPLHVEATFYLRRPKRGAPIYPVRRPDLDKLTRGLLDALTAASVFGDDAQVVDLIVRKRYAAEPRVEVSVETLDHESLEELTPRELVRLLREAAREMEGGDRKPRPAH